MNFDPGDVGLKGRLFGFPYTIEQSDLVVIPVPWDVTVSYGEGTSMAPANILNESTQLDFSLPGIQQPFTYPVALAEVSEFFGQLPQKYRRQAADLIDQLENGRSINKKALTEINKACQEMVNEVQRQSTRLLEGGKIAGVLGGDHSTPLGLLWALASQGSSFGILQIDAHMDLRQAYEGFEFSHASIMYHALNIPQVNRLIQVGIRDYCEEEILRANEDERVHVWMDETIQQHKWSGETWPGIVAQIIAPLPEKVYVSFDVDGLDPALCPTSGTPVPGGLQFGEAVYLIEAIVRSGRTIIGFDLSECGRTAWDANVASRLLYRLSALVGVSRGRLAFVEAQ